MKTIQISKSDLDEIIEKKFATLHKNIEKELAEYYKEDYGVGCKIKYFYYDNYPEDRFNNFMKDKNLIDLRTLSTGLLIIYKENKNE